MKRRSFSLLVFGLGLALALTSLLNGRPNTVKKSSGGNVTVKNAPVRPENTTVPGNEMARSSKIIAPKKFDTKSIDSKMARVNGERSNIVISESNTKVIKAYDTRDITIIQSEIITSPGNDLAVSTDANADFQRMIQKYQKGRENPIDTEMAHIENAGDVVSIDKINKHADPSGSIDAEGIPVEGAADVDEVEAPKPVLRD